MIMAFGVFEHAYLDKITIMKQFKKNLALFAKCQNMSYRCVIYERGLDFIMKHF